MCGRFAFYSPREAVLSVFGVSPPFGLEPHYNIAPTQLVTAIRAGADSGPEAVGLRWGLVPFWAQDPAIGNRLINARAETLAERPAFREAWKLRRCVILADGFYEWRSAKPGSRPRSARRPFYVAAADRQPMAFAGLWERWEQGAVPLETCTIITTAANRALRELHDRMPVILATDAWRIWIDPGQPPEVLKRLLRGPADDRLVFHEVSRAVNSPANDGPELIAPTSPAGGSA
jgi:putative SOS response-associated peptidase YedK